MIARKRLEEIVKLYIESHKMKHDETHIYEICVQLPQMEDYLQEKRRSKDGRIL